MHLPDTWLNNVSRATGMDPCSVKTSVEAWIKNGKSIEYVKRVFVFTALVRGKKLMFVSSNGRN